MVEALRTAQFGDQFFGLTKRQANLFKEAAEANGLCGDICQGGSLGYTFRTFAPGSRAKVVDRSLLYCGAVGDVIDRDETYILIRFREGQKPVCFLQAQAEVIG